MYDKLLAPYTLKNVELKNRLVVTAMVTNYCKEDGFLTDRWMRYHEEKAKGGWGMIITEDYCFRPEGKGYNRIPGLFLDEQIPLNKVFTDKIHSYGSRIICQIYHPGRQSNQYVNGGHQPVAPSAIPCPWLKQIPRAITVEEIHEYVSQFGDAALRAKKAGFDGVEIHLAHGYLLFEMLSPHVNKRTDEYGGCFKNRFRMIREVFEDVKKKVGEDFIVGTRLSYQDGYKGGRGLYDSMELAMNLETAGADYLNVTFGSYGDHNSYDRDVQKHGFVTHACSEIKKVVSIPVIDTNRITTGGVAEAILQAGEADLIGMERTSLADPHYPNKLKKGQEEQIRHCINCNIGCYGSLLSGGTCSCLVNPEVGREIEMDNFKPESKRVLIAGGGPGGMEAAYQAVRAGHKVTLYEASDFLGGQLVSAAFPPMKGEVALFTSWLIRQMKDLKVDFRLNTPLTRAIVEEEKPDAVIVATGGSAIVPNIPGIDLPHVHKAEDVLLGKVVTGEDVVVCGGGEVGVETATAIAFRCNGKVSVVEMLPSVFPSLDFRKLMDEYEVDRYTSTKVKEIKEDCVIVEKNGEECAIPAKTVVLAFGYKPNNTLAEELKDLCDVKVIGGSIKTSNAFAATTDALNAVLDI